MLGRTVLFVGSSLACLALAPAASAATFNVDSPGDTNDADLVDPACRDAFGDCTLRAAIQQANAPASPGQDVINLPPRNYQLSIGELDISSSIVIEGTGAAASTPIRADVASRVFEVAAGARLDLRDATVRDGVLAAPGAGISSAGTLVLRRAVVKANQAFGDTPGGGIFSGAGASLTILDSVIGDPAAGAQANRAGLGAGILAVGSTYTIRNSVIVGNQATSGGSESFGGGIVAGGNGVIVDSTVSRNSADGGGGIVHSDVGGAGSMRIERSTLSGNTAVAGSAIFAAAGSLQIVNSTLSGNAASLRATVFTEGGTTLTHTTLAGNSAPAPQTAGIWAQASPGAAAILRASILDNSGERNCGGPGDVVSAGANLDSGTTCGLGGPGEIVGAEPRLGPLASNGGPTQTRAIAATSPARDAVTSGCPPPATDQRGFARPQGPRCDSGAFELVPVSGGGELELSLSARKKQKAKRLKVDVACGTAACSVELGGKGKVPIRAGVAARARKLRLKPKDVDVAAGETETVRLKFRKNRKTVKKVRALLKRGGKRARKRAKVTVDATATGVGGTDTAKQKIKLKR